MSELSYLEKLLDGVEVEWVTLGSMADIGTGSSNRQDESENGIYPFYVRSKNILKSDTFEFDEVAIVIPGEGGIGDIFHYVEGKYALHQRAYRIRITTNAVDTKFLYYFMSSSFKQYILTKSVGATAISIRKPMLEGFKVPIPSPDNPEKSLAIQSEIVRILDKFTALTAELTAELNMRKKQYNYYRDQLLSFKEGEVEWKTLGEVAKIQRGASPRPIVNYLTEQGNGIPWIKIGDTIPGSKYIDKTLQKITAEGAQKSRILNPGDFVISNSMSFGRPYILRITGAIHDGWASISNFGEKLNTDYLYHYLSSKKVKNYWESKINSGSVSNLNADIIKTLPVPLPDKQKQERISALLDKFDTLTNSITEGLPREIELRQKQYEYYRDLLFSFPKSETVSN
ncbi:TPA: restriction endonuclease subunit S [Escherichia coli]|nr:MULTISPECIES: restriction endonuclease subunit S [Enterobacteriaceae]EAB1768624.1 restriction endonuclease subunit S [Salmonella enterica]EBG2565896.1 restriction endonuclease subunit S [Salmonella enterica subsp. enterica]EBW3522429.1 restriction endonuclease subunit S [Salmonella enterica subsp. enterica serovar Typhimurium]EDT2002770.1 restriction endonuclease subunit S [Salmonella enterica subsp. enterica serovar 4,[5],12:i:-]HCZ2235627.1 restriction endonuclease subunit S [Salmonella e